MNERVETEACGVGLRTPIKLFIESLSNRSLFRSVYMRFDLDLMFI